MLRADSAGGLPGGVRDRAGIPDQCALGMGDEEAGDGKVGGGDLFGLERKTRHVGDVDGAAVERARWGA